VTWDVMRPLKVGQEGGKWNLGSTADTAWEVLHSEVKKKWGGKDPILTAGEGGNL